MSTALESRDVAVLGLFLFGRDVIGDGNMRARTIRKPAGRKFNPCCGALEERYTMTVNTLSVAGFTAGPGGANTVFVGGVLDDSSSTSASALEASYKVTDVQGNVLADGPLTLTPTAPGSLNFGYGTTIPLSVTPGNVETITVSATDADSKGVPTESVANLYVSTVRGVNTLGFGLTANNGDLFGGSGQGKITLTQSPTRGLIAKGKAAFQLGSNPHNHLLLNSTVNGPFQYSVDPLGDMSLSITRGKANYKIGAYAGAPLSTGGLGGVVSGNFSMTRFYDSSIVAQGQGSAFLSFQVGGSTTTTVTANTVTALAHKMKIRINTDSTGHLSYTLVGSMTVNGNFNPSGS